MVNQHIQYSVPFFWSRRVIDFAVSLAHTSLGLCPALCWLSLHRFLHSSSNRVWGDEFRHPADLLAPGRPDRNMRRERRINVRDGNHILVASNSFLLCSACTTSSCVVIAPVRILIYTSVQKFWNGLRF